MLPWNTGLCPLVSLELPGFLILGRAACVHVSGCLLHGGKWETHGSLPLSTRDNLRPQIMLQSLLRYRGPGPLSTCVCIMHAHVTYMNVLYIICIYNNTSLYITHMCTYIIYILMLCVSFPGGRAALWLCYLCYCSLVCSSSRRGTCGHLCRIPGTMSRCLGRDSIPMPRCLEGFYAKVYLIRVLKNAQASRR